MREAHQEETEETRRRRRLAREAHEEEAEEVQVMIAIADMAQTATESRAVERTMVGEYVCVFVFVCVCRVWD